uniref:Uncharacterized protein n=1 Tax=Setaria viridis TaxID=4556 RepID=A0A4U6VUY0_SETVI|nr:hypothetical protein SEVIR_2G216500v2 [Setaria viridis]
MECSTRGGAGDEPVTALASGAGTPKAASRERWATSAAKAREGQTGSLPAGQHRYPNGGGTPAASSSRSTRRTCRSSQWELRSGAQAGGRMGMEGGRAWVSVGRGRGNRGGRRLGPPPPLPSKAAAAAARGRRREGVARRRVWAPSGRLARETTEPKMIDDTASCSTAFPSAAIDLC